ncbi:hypothetical protein [Minwuia sp.]|uniref:hypothetical protein n=1 Tax=Minwuia sp. TaxID=2493630 RepID=UPI003A90DABC
MGESDKNLNKIDLDALSLDYIFSDIILNWKSSKKNEIKKKLDNNGVFMAARKMKSVVNDIFIQDRKNIQRFFSHKTAYTNRTAAQLLILTHQEIYEKADKFYRNIQQAFSVSEISNITGGDRQVISNSIQKIKRDYNSKIEISENFFIELKEVRIEGRSRIAYSFFISSPIKILDEIPRSITLSYDKNSDISLLIGKEWEKILRFYRSGGTVLFIDRKIPIISIYYVLSDSVVTSQYYQHGEGVTKIHDYIRVDETDEIFRI